MVIEKKEINKLLCDQFLDMFQEKLQLVVDQEKVKQQFEKLALGIDSIGALQQDNENRLKLNIFLFPLIIEISAKNMSLYLTENKAKAVILSWKSQGENYETRISHKEAKLLVVSQASKQKIHYHIDFEAKIVRKNKQDLPENQMEEFLKLCISSFVTISQGKFDMFYENK